MKNTAILAAAFTLLAGTQALKPGQCKTLPTDKEWPAEDLWKGFQGVVARGAQKQPTRPDYRWQVKSAADVQKAVNFARENNLRLSIIHSGHDGLARNDAPSGLVLGMEAMKGIRLENTYTPSEAGTPSALGAGGMAAAPAPAAAKCQEGAGHSHGHSRRGERYRKRSCAVESAAPPVAVTLGAGVATEELNKAIASSNVFALGAEHGSVGVAGGWTQCGGYAPMTAAYGLGVDAVLEFKVVTADGQLRIANEKSNPDLYWAMRGGCGSTWGVVTELTVKVFPSPAFAVSKFTINAAPGKNVAEAAAYIHSQMPELSEKGVQGFYSIWQGKFVGTFHTVGTNANEKYATEVMTPIFEKVKGLADIDKNIAVKYTTHKDYQTYFDEIWGEKAGGHKFKRHQFETEEHMLARRHGPGESMTMAPSQSSGKHSAGDGRLLDKDALKHPNLAAAFASAIPAKGMARGAFVVGGAVHRQNPALTSVHPSWRKAYTVLWSDKDVNDIIKLSPGMGAYPNEASWNETNWKETFWGQSNYDKLLKIKEKYDPDFVFYVSPGIGADLLEGDANGKLCRPVEAKASNVYPPMGDNRNMRD